MKVLCLGLLLLLGACGTVPVPSGVVKEAVWVPCPISVPARPVFPAEALTGNEDIWTLGVTLWADRKARQAYELDLETRLVGCTSPKP